MSTVLTRREALRILRADTRDKSYQSHTRSGEDVAQYLTWKKMSGAAPATLDAYEFTLARMCQMFPDSATEDFDGAMLLDVIATLPEKSRRPRGKAPISDFFGWATAWKRLAYNPALLLPDFKVQQSLVYDIFSPSERARIIRAASDPGGTITKNNCIPARDKAGVLLFLDTGARKKDIRFLQWRDVDTADRFVLFRQRKGSRQDVIRFGEALQQALIDAYHTEYPVVPDGETRMRTPEPGDYVLYPNWFNGQITQVKPRRPMGDGSLHNWWYRILERAEIVDPGQRSGRKLHLTRHTHGTEVYEATGDIHATAERLGHASLETTKKYVHNSRKRGEAAVEALELYHATLREDEG